MVLPLPAGVKVCFQGVVSNTQHACLKAHDLGIANVRNRRRFTPTLAVFSAGCCLQYWLARSVAGWCTSPPSWACDNTAALNV
jgi:hypothetical protein